MQFLELFLDHNWEQKSWKDNNVKSSLVEKWSGQTKLGIDITFFAAQTGNNST